MCEWRDDPALAVMDALFEFLILHIGQDWRWEVLSVRLLDGLSQFRGFDYREISC